MIKEKNKTVLILLYLTLFVSCSQKQNADIFIKKILPKPDLEIIPIESIEWRNYHFPIFATRFLVINNSDSNILICGDNRMPKKLSAEWEELYNVMYGRSSNFFFVEDCRFRFFQKDAWSEESPEVIYMRAYEPSNLMIYPKDTVEIWGNFLSGLVRIHNRSKEENKPNYKINFDSLGFTIKYLKMPPDSLNQDVVAKYIDQINQIGFDYCKMAISFPLNKVDSTFNVPDIKMFEYCLKLDYPEDFEDEIITLKRR